MTEEALLKLPESLGSRDVEPWDPEGTSWGDGSPERARCRELGRGPWNGIGVDCRRGDEEPWNRELERGTAWEGQGIGVN